MLPEEIEVHRDRMWRRDPENRVEDVYAAERFIEEVGFCEALTDSRRPGPSLYVAVCGRRDAHMPRNVQKDPESRLGLDHQGRRDAARQVFLWQGAAWSLHVHRATLDSVLQRALGCAAETDGEKDTLGGRSTILKIMRREWEMATRDLREASGISERARFDKAMTQLQKSLKDNSE
jgi:hypothetical protein